MDNETPSASSTSSSSSFKRPKLGLSISPRWIILFLLVVIVAMLLVWKPWHHAPGADARTVTFTGNATVKATPDEFTFYPSYEFTNADKQAGQSAVTAKSNEIVAKLKSLGVADSKIQTTIDNSQNSSGRPNVYPQTLQSDGDYTFTLQINVVAPSRTIAQKVQDYLLTTSPTGTITPYSTFSETTRKKLEAQAAADAAKDARSKAEQSAKNIGYTLGAVKSVEEDNGFSGAIQPLKAGGDSYGNDALPAPDLSVQPGENSLDYSVTVVYYIK
jgi:uncharacterized protein YggE